MTAGNVAGSSAERATPPRSVRLAFFFYLAVVVLSATNALLQLASGLNGALPLVGTIIEAVLFIGLGWQMRAGKQWARGTLLGVSGLFLTIGILAATGLRGALNGDIDALIVAALACVAAKVLMIVAGAVTMYRPDTYQYFR